MMEFWKNKKLFAPSLKIAVIFVFLVLVIKIPKIEGTNSYFTDQEKSAGNFFVAGTWGVSSGEVVINELMWPGSYGDVNDEWIELRNMTDRDIDLSGWIIHNGGSGSSDQESANLVIPTIELDPYIVKAGGYFLILAKEYDETAVKLDADLGHDKGYTDVSGMNLHNGGEVLVLMDNNRNTIDTAWKDLAWPDGYLGQGNDHLRQSMERDDPPGDGTVAGNWHTCIDEHCNDTTYWDSEGNNYGTPGQPNLSDEESASISESEEESDQTEAELKDLKKEEVLELKPEEPKISAPELPASDETVLPAVSENPAVPEEPILPSVGADGN